MITPVSLSFKAIFFLTFCSIFFYLEKPPFRYFGVLYLEFQQANHFRGVAFVGGRLAALPRSHTM